MCLSLKINKKILMQFEYHVKLIVTTITYFCCHFRFLTFSEIFFGIYSTFINKNFSAYTKSHALSYRDLLTSRIFSNLKTFNMFLSLQQTVYKYKLFPLIGLFQKLPVVISEPKLTNQQLWHHRGNLLIMGSVVS